MNDPNVKSKTVFKKVTEYWLDCQGCETPVNSMKLDRQNEDLSLSPHKYIYKCHVCGHEQFASGWYPRTEEKLRDEIDINKIKEN